MPRLSLIHADHQYARQTDSKTRLRIAGELVRRYQQQMLNPDDRKDIPRLISRCKFLLADFPQLNSLQTQIAVHHGQFLTNETRFFDWWQTGASTNAASELAESLKHVSQELDELRRMLEKKRQQQLATLPLAIDSNAEETQLNKTESQLAHVDFLAGWTHYFLAVIPPRPVSDLLAHAQENFYASLHLQQTQSIEKIGDKWLEIEGVFSRRAVLGLGLIYAAQRKYEPSNYCFERLRKLNPQFESELWRLQAIAFARDWSMLKEWQSTAAHQSLDRSAKRKYFKSLTHAGVIAESSAANPAEIKTAKQLQRVGLLGLLREHDFDSIAGIAQTHLFESDNRNANDLWLQAAIDFRAANTPEAFKSVAKQLDAVLADNRLQPSDQPHIQYLASLTQYNQGNFETALVRLDERVLNHPSEQLAESALWLKSRILLRLSRQQTTRIPAALATLNQLDTRFPRSQFAHRIEFEKKLLESRLMRGEQANRILESIPTSSPFYSEALVEKITNHFELWRADSGASPTDQSRRFEELYRSANAFVDDSRGSDEQKQKVILLLIDASINMDLSHSSIENLFAKYQALAGQPENAPANATIQFYRFRFARMKNQVDLANQLATWICENSSTKSHRIAALGYLATRLEENRTSLDQKIAILQQLSSELGGDTISLQSSTAARVAAHRLVEVLIESNQFDRAQALNDEMVRLFPNRQPYLINAARIANNTHNNELAIDLWRKIAGSSKAGESVWLEAKYSIAKIHSTTNNNLARQMVEQTLALSGELSEKWRLKFDDLAKQLSQSQSIED